MTPSRNLRRLERSTTYRLHKLRTLIEDSAGRVPYAELKTIVSAVTIDSLNTWANFCRAYYLSCCLGTRLRHNSYVTANIPFVDINTSIGNVVHLFRPWVTPTPSGTWHRRDEPTWHDASILLKSCQHIGASNIAQIAAALSIGTRVFLDLPVCRNYCAHKNRRTEEAVQNIAPLSGISALLRPMNVLLSVPLNAYDPLIIVWLNDIETVVSLLCE